MAHKNCKVCRCGIGTKLLNEIKKGKEEQQKPKGEAKNPVKANFYGANA
jgi:hypothetical protein